MADLRIDDLRQIPFLDHSVLAGRLLISLTFYSDENWHMWLAVGESERSLVKIEGRPAEAGYYASKPESEDDLSLHFLDFIAQRACDHENYITFSAMLDDILNLSASLAKLDLLKDSMGKIEHGLSRMVATEVEYIFSVCRSLFDLLQEMFVKLWARVQLHDPPEKTHKLKESFNKMIERSGQTMNAEDIAKHYGIPPPIAACYERSQFVFSELRRFRDNLIHRGSQIETIFQGDETFLIRSDMRPFVDLVHWDDSEKQTNNLVPLVPAIETIVFRTISVCDDLTRALESTIEYPPPMVPNMNFFMRGYFMKYLKIAAISGRKRALR